MSEYHLQMNLPVHRARRDACYERAEELLGEPFDHLTAGERVRHIQRIAPLLETAQHHAAFIVRTSGTTQQEHDFYEFLQLVAHHVESILAMLNHQFQLEQAESFLCSFFNTTPEQCVLPALHYERRANDLHEGALYLFRMARTPFEKLKQENREGMAPDDRARYEKARSIYREELLREDEAESHS